MDRLKQPLPLILAQRVINILRLGLRFRLVLLAALLLGLLIAISVFTGLLCLLLELLLGEAHA